MEFVRMKARASTVVQLVKPPHAGTEYHVRVPAQVPGAVFLTQFQADGLRKGSR